MKKIANISLKKNFIYNMALNVANIAFPVVTVPYISRVLAPEGVGISNFVLAYVGYFVLFAKLGINYYGTREIAKVKDDKAKIEKLSSELIVFNIVTTAIVSVVYIASIFLVDKLTEQAPLFLIVFFTLIFGFLQIDWLFSGLEKFKIISLRTILIKILGVIALLIFVKTDKDLPQYLIINVLLVVIPSFWTSFYAFTKMKLSFVFRGIKPFKHFKAVIILFSSILAMNIYMTLDTLMLGFMSSYQQVGYYTSAIKATKLIIPIFTTLGTVLLPRIIFSREKKDDEQTKKLLDTSFDFVVFFAIAATVGVFLISPIFVPVFLGRNFLPSISSMRILSFLIFFIGMTNFFGIQILLASTKDNLFLRAVVSGAILNFCFNLVLIPVLGANGASIASVMAEAVVSIICFILVKKYVNIGFNLSLIPKAIVSTLPMFPIFFTLKHFLQDKNILLLSIFIPIAGIIYFIIQYFAFKNNIASQVVKMLYKFKINS